MGRKAVLFVDDNDESLQARNLMQRNDIEFVEYDVKEREDIESGCCGGVEVEVPSVFAPDGIFKGLAEIERYANLHKDGRKVESESAYW